jgi:hypothetical protein
VLTPFFGKTGEKDKEKQLMKKSVIDQLEKEKDSQQDSLLTVG